ncbi:MAG: 2,3-bisphosphoglycerate-independent phosphoglycerate mutase [Theionarchaea archaeon]|nr:2,3-bisphosphoglycerate-independent phosphoglycerate mutase [Theionarchaea archaeon]
MILLIILDGWGISDEVEGNAILQAQTPIYDQMLCQYPNTTLGASGEDVGLPDNQMGNSEVGHLNLGAGRIVYQDFTRINKAIRDKTFFKKENLVEAAERVKDTDSTLHLIGLVSDGGVHSHISHLFALLDLAHAHGVNPVVHAFLDGRDVLPTSAPLFISRVTDYMKEKKCGTFGTLMGRYYAMDRDNRWKRTQRAYEALTGKKETSFLADSIDLALEKSYARGETDEFVQPTIIGKTITDGDSIIFFNFRPDRARQLTRAFVDDPFSHFERRKLDVYFVCMTEYEEDIPAPVVFPPLSLKNTLGEILSRNGLKQLRIAETEKYYHVTYFFNGGDETAFEGEDRILIPSPQVATYDEKPEMSAYEITEALIKEIKGSRYDVIILNFANADMVGHTGVLEAGIKAIEAVDDCLGRILEVASSHPDAVVIITADHGNAEKMIETSTHKIFTAHTPNRVPFIITKSCNLRPGILADVAPTILDLLDIKKPVEMEGESLIKPL